MQLVLLILLTPTAWAAESKYRDGRPEATLRMDAKDHGVVLRHGDGPGRCDLLGARDVWVFEDNGTYYSITASPGQVIKHGEEFLQFFSATTRQAGNPCVQRTLGIARTKDLDGSWSVDPHPMLPIEEQVENSSLYYEKRIETWFLFTNHIGIDRGEYTDAIWVYWSKDPHRWVPKNKAVVLDGKNCAWSKKCIGLPSVFRVGKRLALFYDAPGGDSTSHMHRDVGLAWLDLPLSAPLKNAEQLQ